MDPSNQTQAEHEQISTALDVEKLEENLYRSKSLWVPARARGVFGGQVISQALVSATNCVSPEFSLHSLHCYFLMSGSPATPIVYFVERLRQGRSYVACSVKAVQKGKIIFYMLCSFQKPEPWQPSAHWKMPVVPPPEECMLEEDRYEDLCRSNDVPDRVKAFFKDYANDRVRSPIAIKRAKEGELTANGNVINSYWMQARNIPDYETPFQKCILSYLTDFYLLGTVANTMSLKRYSSGPQAVKMMSTIDHAIWFYSDSFDCGDWLLYVMTSPRAGSGRGVVHGQLYTRDGTLIAVTTQEGVVRADIRGPPSTTAKL